MLHLLLDMILTLASSDMAFSRICPKNLSILLLFVAPMKLCQQKRGMTEVKKPVCRSLK